MCDLSAPKVYFGSPVPMVDNLHRVELMNLALPGQEFFTQIVDSATRKRHLVRV